jgi:hypothetical protein
VDAYVAKLTLVFNAPLLEENSSITLPLNKYSPGK